MLSVSLFCMMAFIMMRKFLAITSLLKKNFFPPRKAGGFFSNAFCCIIQADYVFLFLQSVNMVCYIDFCLLNHSCILEMNLTWLCYITLNMPLMLLNFFSFSAHGSWSCCFEEWRGRPDKEWWAAKQTLLSNSTKLLKRRGPRRVATSFQV